MKADIIAHKEKLTTEKPKKIAIQEIGDFKSELAKRLLIHIYFPCGDTFRMKSLTLPRIILDNTKGGNEFLTIDEELKASPEGERIRTAKEIAERIASKVKDRAKLLHKLDVNIHNYCNGITPSYNSDDSYSDDS